MKISEDIWVFSHSTLRGSLEQSISFWCFELFFVPFSPMRDTLNIEIDSMKQRHFIIQDVYKKILV